MTLPALTVDMKTNLSELPPKSITTERVVAIIVATEQRRRVVWTAGRILREDGSLHGVMTGEPARRRGVLRKIRGILKALAGEGVLKERGFQFNFGTTTEVGYDFVRVPESAGAAEDGCGGLDP